MNISKTKRSPKDWSIHDVVIEEIADMELDRDKFRLCINLGSSTSCPVKSADGEQTVYPDVAVFAKGSDQAYAIYEVETSTTVNDEEAMGEWMEFSFLADRLILVVPKDLYGKAKEITARLRLGVHGIGTFEINRYGYIELDLPELS